MAGELFHVYGRAFQFVSGEARLPPSLKGSVVSLKSADGDVHEVSAEAAFISDRLRSLLVHSGAEEVIPLPLSSRLLAKVIEYMKYHVEAAPGELCMPLQDTLVDSGALKWDATFVNVEKDALFDLNLAANLLGIHSLVLLSAAKIAIDMRGKAPDKIKKEASVKKDMAADDEDALKELFRQAWERNYPRLPGADTLLENAAVVQGSAAAAERNSVLTVHRTEAGECAIDIKSWKHAMWRTAALWDWRLLQEAPAEITEDRDLILGSMSMSSAEVLQLAPTEWKSDQDFILEAARSSARALEKASEDLKQDKGFVMKCVLANPLALAYADPSLRGDRNFVLEAVSSGRGAVMGGATDEVRQDPEFVLKVLAADTEALRYAHKNLLADKGFALKAVGLNGLALQHFSAALQADREVASAAVQENFAAAQYVHASRRAEMGLTMDWDMTPQVALVQTIPTELGPRPYGPFFAPPEKGARYYKAQKHVQYTAGSTMSVNMGQGNYIAANSWLDKLPFYERPEIDGVANMWGSVGGIGMRWKAFATMDIVLQMNEENNISVEEAKGVIRTMICAMDPPEWVYFQTMSAQGREGMLTTTAGVVVGSPGGGYKPGETSMDPEAFGRKGLQAPAAGREEGSIKDAAAPASAPAQPQQKPDAKIPLGSWPGLFDTGARQLPLSYVEGAPVILKGLGAKSGVSGILVRKSGVGRWKVKLGDGSGNALLKEDYLQLAAPTPPAVQEAAAKPPPEPKVRPPMPRYCIIGSWNSWLPQEMPWKETEACYKFTVKIGPHGNESFQILVDGSVTKCLHPSAQVDGCPNRKYDFDGPDPREKCLGQHWTIGRDVFHRAAMGEFYEVRAASGKVEWSRVEGPTIEDTENTGRDQMVVTGDGWKRASDVETEVAEVKKKEESLGRVLPRQMCLQQDTARLVQRPVQIAF